MYVVNCKDIGTDAAQLTKLQSTQFQTVFLKKRREIITFLNALLIFPCTGQGAQCGEGGGGMLLGDNRWHCGRAAADRVSSCLSLDSNRTALYMYVYS